MQKILLIEASIEWLTRIGVNHVCAKTCLSTDIPDFLKFHVPKTDVFSDPAVHSFQLKLLRSEISTAAETHHQSDQKRTASRSSPSEFR